MQIRDSLEDKSMLLAHFKKTFPLTLLGTLFFFSFFFFHENAGIRTAGEEGGHFFNSSLPLLPASQTLRHQPGDYCRELTSAHNQQPNSKQEPLVSERKSLTTKLRALLRRAYWLLFCYESYQYSLFLHSQSRQDGEHFANDQN